ncbi:MAG: ATPase, T2SS/T4P/T4SS family, partial [Pirellulaceae bacterium]
MTVVKQILCPTDFSRHSSAALMYACDLARESDAALHLVHVHNGSPAESSPHTLLNRIARSINPADELRITTVKAVVEGRPHQAIVNYVGEKEIDLVVMGTHGRTGLAHLTMGSVTAKVVRDSPCPVLVLGPREGESASLNQAAQLIQPQIEQLPDDRDEALDQMSKLLSEGLDLPAVSCLQLLDELERRRWLKWRDGGWTINDAADLADQPTGFQPDRKSESQATDLIMRGNTLSATDIHIDPVDDEVTVVRMRIDGQLEEYCRMSREVTSHLINQLKNLGDLDIAEPFRVQEGRLRMPPGHSDIEVRMTSIPVAGGEAVALRLATPERVFFPITQLGLSESALETVNQMLRQQEGVVLVTGPTGSGKTTTVYSMLEMLGGEHRNIVSIEDPVEYAVPFVRQMNVDIKHQVTMSSGLKTMLRMDPDVLFVGEIRDEEAATIAMQAARSGKYVLSTLHTRDVASTIVALRDLGLQDRSIAENVTGIVNQRLVRRLCDQCKRPVDALQEQALE